MKKYAALVLALCLVFNISAQAANTSKKTDTSNMTEQMQEEVQSMVNARLEEVKAQFEGKEPGYLYAYTEYLTMLYGQVVMERNGILARSVTKRLDNGGVARYSTVDAAGDRFDVVILMFDKEDSYDYLLENWSPGEYSIGDFLTTALGYVPVAGSVIGAAFDIIDGLIGIFGDSEWEKIQAADGYVQVECVVARGYPGPGVTMISGWSTHPNYVSYSSLPSSINIEVEEFPN